jgi:hypothetical protein
MHPAAWRTDRRREGDEDTMPPVWLTALAWAALAVAFASAAWIGYDI